MSVFGVFLVRNFLIYLRIQSLRGKTQTRKSLNTAFFLQRKNKKTQNNDKFAGPFDQSVLCSRDDPQELFALDINQCFGIHKVYNENEIPKI